MHKKNVLILSLFVCFTQSIAQSDKAPPVLIQLSTINALMSGIYNGDMTLKTLLGQGDFGIGTLNGLDGEMIILNDTAYQITSDGAVHKPPPEAKTPFAEVTRFKGTSSIKIREGATYAQTIAAIDSAIVSRNLFYAIRITGLFDSVTARSVPRQQRPYRELNEVVKSQSVFQFQNRRGTIAGFRCPAYSKGINVPGYHLHFLASDFKGGGHVLNFRSHGATVEIEEIDNLALALPGDSCFLKADLSPDRENEIKKVEK